MEKTRRRPSRGTAPPDPCPSDDRQSLTSELLNSPAKKWGVKLKNLHFEPKKSLKYIEELVNLKRTNSEIEFVNQMNSKHLKVYKNIKHVNQQYLRKYVTKQFGFALIFREHCIEELPLEYPDHNRENGDAHTEEILIEHIEKSLHKNSQKLIHIFIYTFNSPCLSRPDGKKCCMEILQVKATEWNNKYGIRTEVGYTKYWGLTGPKYLLNVPDSKIKGSPIFEQYLRICETQALKLDWTLFKDKSDIFYMISEVEKKERPEIYRCIEQAISHLRSMAQSKKTIKEHRRCFREKISTLTFKYKSDEIKKKLLEKCEEMIEGSSMKWIRKQMAIDLNMRSSEYIQHGFGPNCPLQIKHYSEKTLDKNNDELVKIIRKNIFSSIYS
ncbi:uncharacterized protein LOC115048304 [Echeneis naucrates]|uniref:uncharacterized protein LOC115048304 n=1 Tax=Echeneis naucrates TaxID=173247 RepID=UPI001113D81F|nr:uncharacterized protein LOC115048304 [Echeneis naucrates]